MRSEGVLPPPNITCDTQELRFKDELLIPDTQRGHTKLYSQLNCSALHAANPRPSDMEHSLTFCQRVQSVDHELEDGAAHLRVV